VAGPEPRGGSGDVSKGGVWMPAEPEKSTFAAIDCMPPRKKIAVFCGPNDSFLEDIHHHLAQKHEIRRFEGQTAGDMQDLMQWSDLSWFEWCDERVVQASRLDRVCPIICRLHSYEVFTDMPGRVQWQNIDDLVFVAPHIRDIALIRIPNLDQNVRISVIHNGVAPQSANYADRPKGYNIAYVGYLNHKKNPSLMLQCMRYLVDIDDRYILHIAGEHQEMRFKLYVEHMIQAMQLDQNIRFHGWVDDVGRWLGDKHFILSTSLLESFGYGIAEAMACGLKPLIHNFIGARALYPEKYLFNCVKEFAQMVLNPQYHPAEYRQYIERTYSLDRQLREIESLLATCLNEIGLNNMKTERGRVPEIGFDSGGCQK
jgi:glycosyltransferase involved in cell wall biosynthesis